MSKKGLILLVLPLLLMSAQDAQAQFRIGPQVAWGDDSADLAVGGRFILNTGQPLVAGAGSIYGLLSFDWFVDCDNCSYFEITPAAFVPITVGEVGPFAGLGLNIGRVSYDVDSPGLGGSDTDIGLALLGGLQFPLGGQLAMAEARLTLGGAEHLVLTFAYLFGGGGGGDGN